MALRMLFRQGTKHRSVWIGFDQQADMHTGCSLDVFNSRNRMALVEHIALRAMCLPRDAVSSMRDISIRGSFILPYGDLVTATQTTRHTPPAHGAN